MFLIIAGSLGVLAVFIILYGLFSSSSEKKGAKKEVLTPVVPFAKPDAAASFKEIIQSSAELDKIKIHYRQLQDQFDAEKNKHLSDVQELDKIKEQLQVGQKELEQRKNDASKAEELLGAKDDQLKKLTAKIEPLEKKNSELLEQAGEFDSQIAEFRKEIERLNVIISSHDKERQSGALVPKDEYTQIQKLLNEERLSFKKQLSLQEQLSAQVADLKQQLAQKDNAPEALEKAENPVSIEDYNKLKERMEASERITRQILAEKESILAELKKARSGYSTEEYNELKEKLEAAEKSAHDAELLAAQKTDETARGGKGEEANILKQRLDLLKEALRKSQEEAEDLRRENNSLKKVPEPRTIDLDSVPAGGQKIYIDQIQELKKMLFAKDAKINKLNEDIESAKKGEEGPTTSGAPQQTVSLEEYNQLKQKLEAAEKVLRIVHGT